jgi:pimeloyl-ACP methyl ester carboxylesterase
MKTEHEYCGSCKTNALLAAALLTLSLIASPTLAGSLSQVTKRADPFVKGATRQIERAEPERLHREAEFPEFAERHTNWQRLAPELFRCATTRSNHVVYIAIHRMNHNPDRPVLVLLHGVLSDYSMWEYVTPELVPDYEVWLVDLPGGGDSDAPKPSALETDGYSPTAMAERILQALQQRFDAEPNRGVRTVVLGGHSLGGTVCIRMLSAPELRARYAPVVERVNRMVLFAPGDLAINAVPTKFLPLLGLKGWMVDAARGLGVWDKKVRDLTKDSYNRPECATMEHQRRFDHALQDSGHREAAKAMLRQFVRFDPKSMRPEWPWIDSLVAEYQNISVPVLIAHGAWDETLSVAMGHKLKNEIPGATLVIFPRCSHAVPTEQPALCAELIRQFSARGEVRAPMASGLNIYPASLGVSAGWAGNYPLGMRPEGASLDIEAKGRLP